MRGKAIKTGREKRGKVVDQMWEERGRESPVRHQVREREPEKKQMV
jgi:hypothetical protein